MQTRMERHAKANTEEKRRSKINEKLYEEIYDLPEYSNIEGIEVIEKTNEIDLSKIKEMLQKRQEATTTKRVVAPKRHTENTDFLNRDDEKNYDIRDILTKAKDSRDVRNDKPYRLDEEEYKYLERIRSDKKYEREDLDKDELKELIHTITNTSVLNKMGDKELSLGIFDDLRGDHTITVEESSFIENVLKDAEISTRPEKEIELDKSFYTSSFGFKEEDFEELKEINTTLKKNNLLIKILVSFLIVLVLGIGAYVLFSVL